ncbi:hypothetical protein LI177_05250 [bacterium 210820-DFI.6.37]|nr:hypothetical protein [bacterium 210820-DFI.6.37]
MIEKGIVSSLQDGKAIVLPRGAEDVAAGPLYIPERLWNRLWPQMWVAYATFSDGTGVVLEIMDG